MTPLRPDSACCRQLNWRTDLPPEIDPEGLEALLAEQGWSNRCHHPGLKVLSHEHGHEAAWVMASGRVQLRIHVTVEESERHDRALEIYGDFQDCLTRLRETSSRAAESKAE